MHTNSYAPRSRSFSHTPSTSYHSGGSRPAYNSQRYTQAGRGPKTITLKEPYISQIIQKVKTVEGRINSGQFLQMRVGENVVFCNQAKKVNCRIDGKKVYGNFREMLEAEGLKNCLPNARSLDEGVAIYESLPGFVERAARHGVVALKISVVDSPAAAPERKVQPALRLPEILETNPAPRKRTRDERDQDAPETKEVKEPASKKARIEEKKIVETKINQTASKFVTVYRNSPYFAVVKEQFESVIAPIYGSQAEALKRIASGTDRACEVLLRGPANEVAGILVYKLHPTDEFAEYGIRKALELKTLFVVNAATQSGRGIGSELINRIQEIASQSKFESIAVTVSNEKNESQEFFKKKNFVPVKVFRDKYKEGIDEVLFAYRKPNTKA